MEHPAMDFTPYVSFSPNCQTNYFVQAKIPDVARTNRTSKSASPGRHWGNRWSGTGFPCLLPPSLSRNSRLFEFAITSNLHSSTAKTFQTWPGSFSIPLQALSQAANTNTWSGFPIPRSPVLQWLALARSSSPWQANQQHEWVRGPRRSPRQKQKGCEPTNRERRG